MSIIRSIFVKNFKAIGEAGATIAFAPVTLLFGPNSAGKSSIIQALHYAFEVLSRDNPDADRTLIGGRAVELGGFRNMVHQRDVSREIVFTFHLDFSGTDLPVYRVDYVTSHARVTDWGNTSGTADVTIAISWSDDMKRPYVSEMEIEYQNGVWVGIGAKPLEKDATLRLIAGWPTIGGEEAEDEHVKKSGRDSSVATKEQGTVDEAVGGNVQADETQNEQCRILAELLPEIVSDTYLEPGPPPSIDGVSVGGVRDALPRRGRPLEFPRVLWRYLDEPEEHREFTEQLSSLTVGPIDLLRDELSRLVYIGPLRDVPERHIQAARSPDPSRWSSGLAAWDLLAADPESLIRRVNHWLAEPNRFASGYEIEIERYREVRADSPLGAGLASGALLDAEQARTWYEQLLEQRRVRLVDGTKHISLAPQDLGVGLSQTIPILVASNYARDTLVLIEQPELHIHPAMQVEMGDLFIQMARERQVCFLVETHSEHLLLRVLRRIRETSDGEVPPGEPECRKEDVAVYFVEPDPETRGTRVTQLRVTDDGSFLDRWPRGFFEERAEELF